MLMLRACFATNKTGLRDGGHASTFARAGFTISSQPARRLVRLCNMRQLACRSLLVAGLALPVLAQPAPPADLTAADARADFDMLRKAIEEAHGAPYRFLTKVELDRRFDAIRARIGGPLSQRAFIGLLSEALAALGDGHSRIEYDGATTAALASARLLPLKILVEAGRLIVFSNDTPGDATIRPGMEIRSINGRAAKEVLSAIVARLPADGFIETGRRGRLFRTFPSAYWLFVDTAETFSVSAIDAAGKSVTAELAGISSAEREKNVNPVNAAVEANMTRLDGPKENVSLRFVDEPAIAVLKIRGFGGEAFRAEVEAAVRTLRERGAKALILDLRRNGGGVDEYGAFLVSQFVAKPFRYFDRIHIATTEPSFSTWKPETAERLEKNVVPDPAGGFLATPALHSGVGEQPPAAAPYLGPLLVLIDGGSFSTTADVTAVLRHLKRATFVGEETGGAYQGNTSGLNAQITLPHSKLRYRVQMYGYHNAVSGGEPGRGTRPDVPVPPLVADVLRGVDAALERAVSLARAAISK